MDIKNSIWLKMSAAQKVLAITIYFAAWLSMNAYAVSETSHGGYFVYFTLGTLVVFNGFMAWASMVLVRAIRLANAHDSEE